MRRNFVITTILLLTISCLSTNTTAIQQGISATQTSIAALPPPAIYTPETMPEATQSELPQNDIPLVQDTPETTPVLANQGKIGESIACGNAFIARVMQSPEISRDLFEHHAIGTFIIVLLEMENITQSPIQIWDEDYYLDGLVNGVAKIVPPQKAATGYLFITRGNNLYQDKINPGERWKTYLAFDVNPAGAEWKLVVTPGKESGNQICEAVIRLW